MSTSDHTAYAALVADFHELFTRDPGQCINKGVDRFLDRLRDPSLAAIEQDAADAEALLERIRAFDRAGLSFDESLDLDLADLALERMVYDARYTFNGRTTAQQLPDAGEAIGNGLLLLMINDPRPDADRLADITARLEGVPAHLQGMADRLDTPITRWRDMDAQKVSGLGDLYQTLLGWAEGVSFGDLDRMKAAAEAAVRAGEAYVTRLNAMETSNHFHVGPEIAARLLKLRGIDRSFDDLHAMARDFLAESQTLLEALRVKLVQKYDRPADTPVADLQSWLIQQNQLDVSENDFEVVLRTYREEQAKIEAFIKDRDLFPIPDDQALKIIQTPSFMMPSLPAGAMLPAPAFREGVKTGIVYLTLSPELLPEHTALNIPGMMIHEGIPGHHLQLAHAARHASVIRRHAEPMEYAEGWTTMLEDYMLDVGYMGDLTDEARFIGRLDLARVGARVVIDLFFMTGDRRYLDVGIPLPEEALNDPDPFVPASALLKAVTGFVDGRVHAETSWYSQERGYPLSYLTGNRLVWALKQDMIDAQTHRADGLTGLDLDRAFHTAFLEAGNMPVSFLRRVFEEKGLI